MVPSQAYESLTDFYMPDDWSVIQVGSKGAYQKHNFEVIGRVRLQLQQDYKNFWCLWYEDRKKYAWLAESFGKYITYESSFLDVYDNGEFSGLKIGHKFIIHDNVTVVANYQEQCVWISLEGELCLWPILKKGFALVDAQNNDRMAACFIIPPDRRAGKFLVGEVVDFHDLNLVSIREWDEWK